MIKKTKAKPRFDLITVLGLHHLKLAQCLEQSKQDLAATH
jgi:hypothetical protein